VCGVVFVEVDLNRSVAGYRVIVCLFDELECS
jgi:hypothetical protein